MVKCTMLNFHKDLAHFSLQHSARGRNYCHFLSYIKFLQSKKINRLDENGLAISISSAFSLTFAM